MGGPLYVLKVSLEASKKNSESVIFYVLSTQKKQEMSELIQENITKAQAKQKHCMTGIPELGNLYQDIQL